MAITTICEAFARTAAEHPDRVALRTRGGGTVLTWREYADRVHAVAAGLHALGLRRGSTLALMLTNRPEFHVADAAATHLGAIPFSVYNTSSPAQIAFLLEDAGARIVVCEEAFAGAVRAAGAALDHVIVVDGDLGLDAVAARGAGTTVDVEAEARAAQPGDVLTLIYTSGTTGPPKGVQITHRNMVSTAGAFDAIIPYPEGANVVSYLPMAHIAERNCSHYFPMVHGFSVTCCPDAREVVAYFPEVRPGWFFAVPRVFEKLKAGIEAAAPPPLRDAIARSLDGRATAGDAEIMTGLRARLGLDRLEALNVGAAPTPPEVIEFFHALGLPLGELWGMSETTGAGTCNRPGAVRIGTVGPPEPGVEVRLDDDGEVLVRGDCVTPGYRNRPELTAEAFTDDGWLRTGDVGAFDAAGHLSIVDRKKELIINAAGNNMSPANIEARLKASSPLIGQAVAVGDRRPYNVALIVLDPDGAAAFARERELGERPVAELAADPAVQAEVAAAVERANARLSRVEAIRRFRVLEVDWEPGGEELTPTMKLRRRPVAEKYAAEIAGLYD
jgi:long-subunit acyl-CoA synthetase (AMP-forming)